MYCGIDNIPHKYSHIPHISYLNVKIFRGILSLPKNTVMDVNNVVYLILMPPIETKFRTLRSLTHQNVMLAWMIEIWMKNHSVNDNVCNIVNIICPNFFFKQGVTNNVRLTSSVGDTAQAVSN